MNRSRFSTRLAALLLSAVILCPLAASCADNSNKKGADTSAAVTDNGGEVSTDRLYADVPKKNFDGYEFNALYWYVSGWDWRKSKDIVAEENSADTIIESVYKRNLTISENYNITFKLTEVDSGQLNTQLHKNVIADDDVFTIVCQRQLDILNPIMNGDLKNIRAIPYVDLTKPWWDQNSVENYSLANRVYLVASDITINDKDGTAAVAFNKQAATDNHLPDLYEMAQNGTWTVDALYNSYKDSAKDLDGNSKMNEKDFFGFIGGRDVTTSFFSGSGAKIISKDENDIPTLSIMNDRNVEVLQRLFDLTSQTDNFYNMHQRGIDDATFRKLFEEGHGLYHWIRLDSVSAMRASETEFGILPIPKYNEEQNRYYCVVSVYTSSLMSVPSNVRDPERTGILLEALATESKYTLMHAYYDVALKSKYSRDEESSAMLDIIIGNRVFDVGDVLNPGGLRDFVLGMSLQKSNTFVSSYKKLEKAAEKSLNTLITKIEKLPE